MSRARGRLCELIVITAIARVQTSAQVADAGPYNKHGDTAERSRSMTILRFLATVSLSSSARCSPHSRSLSGGSIHRRVLAAGRVRPGSFAGGCSSRRRAGWPRARHPERRAARPGLPGSHNRRSVGWRAGTARPRIRAGLCHEPTGLREFHEFVRAHRGRAIPAGRRRSASRRSGRRVSIWSGRGVCITSSNRSRTTTAAI